MMLPLVKKLLALFPGYMVIGLTVTSMSVLIVKIVLCLQSCVGIGESLLPYRNMRAGKSMTPVKIKAIYCHEDPSGIMVCFPVERGS